MPLQAVKEMWFVGFLKWAVEILAFAAACSGFFAWISAKVWSKDSRRFDREVEREVNRRLKDTKIVSNFNVRMVVVDEASDVYEKE